MIFNTLIGLEDEKEMEKIRRTAVRAVIFEEGKLLTIKSNKGDCKLPGGGVHSEESFENALVREIKEETGYLEIAVKEKIGMITERKYDCFDQDKVFEMISHYYLCTIGQNQSVQNLDDYEEKLGFQPCWIKLENAIKINEEQLAIDEDVSSWVERELFVFKTLHSSEYISE